MKKFLILLITVGLVGTSCYKTDPNNPYSDVSNFEIGSYLTLVDVINLQVNSSDLSNANVGITVDEYGSAVKEINLLIADGSASDPTKWKAIKTVPFTGTGTEISCTGPEMSAALGYDPLPGVTYTMINQIVTEDGRTFDLSNTNGEFESQSSYNMAMRWEVAVVCSFDAAASAGDYQIDVDTWQDYSPGDIITNAIEAGPGLNQLTMHVYPNPDYGDPINPIIIDVDPLTGNATVAKVLYANYGADYYAEGTGIVFSCTGSITLNLTHSSAGGSGLYKLVMHKVD